MQGDPEVIALLNSSFVPVYAVNEDYSRNGAAPAEEKAGFGNYPADALDSKSYDYINGKCKPRPRNPR